ncbi:MAG: ABC transporter ATP-binding protein [Ruminococcaceae bacterium]|nr:ABC transporter ATP-binding protein [Oscillospiraceae bacterium]
MIKTEALRCFYGRTEALFSTTLQIEDGMLTGILGANGSGKSTLFKGICRRISTKGACFVDNIPSSAPPRELARVVAYVPQKAGLGLNVSARDAVLMGAHGRTAIFGDYSRQDKLRAEALLEEFGQIPPDKNFGLLSAGQQQLVILARSVMQGANNLIMDEPDSALDFANRHRVFERIKALSRDGRCVLLSLHDPNFALKYCDRLLFLDSGRIFEDICPKKEEASRLEAAFARLYGRVELYSRGEELCLSWLGER